MRVLKEIPKLFAQFSVPCGSEIFQFFSLNFPGFFFLFDVNFFDTNVDLGTAVSVANDIRSKFPRILMTSEANKSDILMELNDSYSAEFSFANVWTDRTTAGNQYRYLARHLEEYGDAIELRNQVLTLKENSASKVEGLLSDSATNLSPEDYGEVIWIDLTDE